MRCGVWRVTERRLGSRVAGLVRFASFDPRRAADQNVFDTAWQDWNPDQALRVAAGILRKQAPGGAWWRNRCWQRSEAFRTMQ